MIYAEEALNLSPEDRAMFADVRGEMEQWIEKSVNRLQKEMGEEITKVADSLNAQVDEVAEEFKAARERMDKILDSIEALGENLAAGDGETITSAIKVTRNQIGALRAELEAREARWKGLGKGIVNTGLEAVSSIVKIPFLS